MVASRQAPTFGKRGRPPPVRAASSSRSAPTNFETTESGVPLSVLAASLMQKPAKAEAEAAEWHGEGTVPYSWLAGLLAGLVVSLLQAGTVIVAARAQSASLSGLATLAGINAQSMVPLVIAGSVLNGAQATGFTILTAHSFLKRRKITGHAAYALGGAAAAAVYALAQSIIGFGAPEHGWLIEIATGLGAGFFYRVFAGIAAR